jgi:acetylornithine/succinyldiaminopimelate/putrescine aminotransferase
MIKITFGRDPDEVSVNGVSNRMETLEEYRAHIDIAKSGLARNFRVSETLVATGRGDANCIVLKSRGPDGVERKECIDLVAAFGATGLGNGNSVHARRVGRQLKRGTPQVAGNLVHPLHMPTILALREISGMPDARIFFCNDSATAVSAAIRLALNHYARARGLTLGPNDPAWSRIRIVMAERGYHGSSDLARLSLSGVGATTNIGPMPGVVEKVPFGNIDAIRELFKNRADGIAAIVLEPVQGAAGCVAPPVTYLGDVAALCKQYGVLFIADEVKTGFGRLGEYFYCPSIGVMPDLICAGKSAGAGMVPFSFVIGRPDVMDGFEHTAWGVTWSASPQQCVGLLSVIKQLSDPDRGSNWKSLLYGIRERSQALDRMLEDLRVRFPKHVTAIDGIGMMRSIETVFDGKMLADNLVHRGVYTTAIVHPDLGASNLRRVYVTPVLTITKEQIDKVGMAFGDAIARFAWPNQSYSVSG